jgi:alkylation response protein AidB-like acyl-CoA dehydrogenase
VSTERQSREVAEAARETEWTLPSFGKELFLGRFRLDLLHPHPRASAEDRQRGEEFLAKLEQFLRSSVDPLVIERDGQIPDDVVRGLAELGALGMTVPQEYGGLGLSKLYYTRALQLAGSVHGSISTLLSAHQSIGVAQPLMLFGTEAQKRKYLPLVATTEISAFLLTEPDVGSDPARMSSSAVPTADGSAYILDGLKLWTTNGVIADRLVVMAKVPRSEGHRGGISAFIVDAHSPGITVEYRNDFMGMKGIENGVTRFENVRVPAEDLVGAEGLGLKIALTTLNTGRLSLPAVCASSTKWALKIAREWSNERVQWGKPIGQHEAVAQKIAYIAALAYGQEAVVDVCALMADNKQRDIRIEAALAKLFTSEMAWLAVDELIQIRGGRGFETAASLKARGEKPVACEQVLRDLRINRIFEGSSEIMRLLIAREAVDQHLKVAGALVDDKTDMKTKARAALGAGKFYAGWLPQLAVGQGTNPRAFAEFGTLAEHLRSVERSSRKLARSIVYGMGRWQARLEYRQAFLGRLVDIAAELFAMTCACVRARMLVVDGAPEASGAVDLADLFCRGSRRRVDRLFHDLMHNDDAHNYETAQRILEGQFLWAEAGIIDPSGVGPMLGLPEKSSVNVHRAGLARKAEKPEKPEKPEKTEKVAAVG